MGIAKKRRKKIIVRITAGRLGWADHIFVMEKRHLDRLRAKFGAALTGKLISCLHITDDYGYMDEALIAQLETAVGAAIERLLGGGLEIGIL